MTRLLASASAALGLLFVLLSAPPASASDCGSIRDSDERSLCRALERKNPSECGSIRDSDARAYCRAVTRENRSECGSISDSDLRARCRAETGGSSSSSRRWPRSLCLGWGRTGAAHAR
jgi:hypothetical protein